MDGSSKRRGAARGVAILVVGFLSAGAFVVGPATAGKFLTKKAGDKRYINVGEKAADADTLDGTDSSGFLASGRQAYAMVNRFGPVLVPERTRGFTAVTRPQTGVYCLTPAPGVDISKAALATPEYFYSFGEDLHVSIVSAASAPCSAGQLKVATHSSSAFVDTISFFVLVPA